jgi:hypothetical protein
LPEVPEVKGYTMNDVLKFAANEYSFGEDTLSFISDSTNKMYTFAKDGKPYILRVS